MPAYQADLIATPVSCTRPAQLELPPRRFNNAGAMNANLKPLLVIFAAILLVVGYSVYSRATRKPEVIPWVADLATAKAESAKTGRPVFAYFTADWCPPCQQMKATTFADDGVKRALESYVPVKIDVDRHTGLAGQYGAHAIPTMVVIDPAGNEKARMVGYLDPDDMIKWLGAAPRPTTMPSTQPQ